MLLALGSALLLVACGAPKALFAAGDIGKPKELLVISYAVATGADDRILPRFAPVKPFFSVQEFGGWEVVNKTFFDNGGLWDRLSAQSR